MEEQEITRKEVLDLTLNQTATLTRIYREEPFHVWLYVLEYADGKKRERFASEVIYLKDQSNHERNKRQ